MHNKRQAEGQGGQQIVRRHHKIGWVNGKCNRKNIHLLSSVVVPNEPSCSGTVQWGRVPLKAFDNWALAGRKRL